MSTKLVCFDSVDGAFWGDIPDLVVDPRAVTVEVPAGVAYWRLVFDVETQTVSVKFPELNDEDAAVEAQAEEVARAEALVAAREARGAAEQLPPPDEA